MEAGGETQFATFLPCGMRGHDEDTQRRTQRQGIEGRDTHRHGHRQSELRIESAGGSAHKAHGDEHRHEDQGRCNDGCRDAAHRLDGGFIGRGNALVELGLYRLHYDNRIIDHRTDNQYEGKERQQVDAEPSHIEEGERTDQRHDNRHHRDERSAETL